MSNALHKLYRFGGLSLIASGCLFMARSVLELIAGPPPSSGLDILAWTASRASLLAISNEVFFFAVMFLVPAVVALHASLATTHRVMAAVGCGIIAVTIPCLYVLAIVHGRLMFPVYHLKVHTPDVAELVVALYYGGLHAAAILLGVATFVLSLAMRRTAYGSGVAYLGFVTAALDLIGSYPDAVGPTLVLISGTSFAAWFVVAGFRLSRMPAALPPLTS